MKNFLTFILFSLFSYSSFAQSKIAAGAYHTLMIRSDGTLWAWGDNNNGQLGNGTTSNVPILSPIQVGTESNWASVEAGTNFSIAIKTDGTLWSWGWNYAGQLGDGTYNDRYTPVQVGSATNWVKVACGSYFVIALKSNGTAWGWGYNGYGQLGNGTQSNVNIPQQVGNLTSWIDVGTGESHSLLVKNDGTVWTSGFNYGGQLGDGTFTSRSSFLQVSGVTSVIKVAGGTYHSLALLSNGTARSWGANNFGELGNGSFSSSLTPVVVSGVNTATKIASGFGHSVFLLSNGQVVSCGRNFHGELGDGTNTHKSTVVIANGISNAIYISSYNISTGAIQSSNGNMACMTGLNDYGQLGDGTTTNRNSFACNAVGPTLISTSAIVGSTFCASGNIPVSFTVTGNINSNNNFTAQLSDATGSFDSPTNIGSISSVTNGTINTTLSGTAPAGSAYRIRVIATSPPTIGSDNGADITLNASQTWYLDADNDQYYLGTQNACSSPGATWHLAPVIGLGDCNDNNATIYPGTTRACYTGPGGTAGVGACKAGVQTCQAGLGTWGPCTNQVVPTSEVCNGIDDDCDGQKDEGFSPLTYYRDADNDLYYISTQIACSSPGIGWHLAPIIASGDCDDNNSAVHTGIVEVCNGIDDNCNSQTDEGFNPVTYYYDNDGDNYGATIFSLTTCNLPPPGFVVTPGDCNDSDNHIWPNAAEISNCIDDNCNLLIDEDVEPTTWYFDNDGDNFGNTPTIQNCAQPLGYVFNGGDCNDNNNMVWPGQTEIVNGIDDNCNGLTDEGFTVLHLKLFIQGLYEGNSTMRPVPYNTGFSFDQNLADTITVELHQELDPTIIVATKTTSLEINGDAWVSFPPNLIGGSYFIVVKHRSSIETWSKDPVLFSGNPTTFDFTAP